MDKIREIIRYFKLNVHEIIAVPESFSSEVYGLKLASGALIYVKIPYNKAKLVRERIMLERLSTQLPVPQVLDCWEGDDAAPGALLLSALPGNPISGIVSPSLSYEIGCLLGRLHSVEMPGYGSDGVDGFKLLPHNDWRLYIQHNFDNQISICEQILEPDLFSRCLTHFEQVFRGLPAPDGPCVVHFDFRPGNILADEHGIVGLIDFESARGGSSEHDFTKLNRYVWMAYPGTKEAFEAGYTSIRPLISLDMVLPFYSFYDAFSAVVWCQRRGIENNRRFLEESISTLQDLVV
jgi:hypothetical protein